MAVLFVFAALLCYEIGFFVFFLWMSLPVLVLTISLGFGNVSALAATLFISLILAILFSPSLSFLIAFTFLLPSVFLGHISSLARPASEIGGSENHVAWYPLADIATYICVLATMIATFLSKVIYGTSKEMASEIIRIAYKDYPDKIPHISQIEKIKSFIIVLRTVLEGFIWVIILFAVWYMAMRIASYFNLSQRMREDMPSSLRMNHIAIPIIAVSISILLFYEHPIAIAGRATGAFGAGFLLSGFARLHLLMRNKTWGFVALSLVYISTVSIIPLLIIVAYGLAETARLIVVTPAKPPKY
ncbi:hypothetical protein [Candidatus Liberibacter sp.]|uniref:hypothetical protein n=1 Tax=Candidatus Liberibacter sp. TaxID=34022 RepID=UPI001C7135EF|nr:hypothetical protein [Candidatus Liberibacter sp.]